jgi:hypothetical protein
LECRTACDAAPLVAHTTRYQQKHGGAFFAVGLRAFFAVGLGRIETKVGHAYTKEAAEAEQLGVLIRRIRAIYRKAKKARFSQGQQSAKLKASKRLHLRHTNYREYVEP